MTRLYTVHVNIPQQILDLAKVIRDQGGRALLVGGCVRDELMGHQPKDWDVEVYGIDRTVAVGHDG